MNIVIIAPDLSGKSGWSRYAADLGRALHQKGHTIHAIVAEHTDADWCIQYKMLRAPTSYQASPLLCRIYAWKLQRLLKKIQPEIVHVMAEPYALLLPFIKNKEYRTIMTIHGTYAIAPLRFAAKDLFIQAYKMLDAVITVSNFTKSKLKESEPALFAEANLEEKITVIHNAVDCSITPHHSKQSNSTKRIMSVSAVKQKKGYIQAINALALFLKNHPIDVHYDIYGSTDVDTAFIPKLLKHIEDQGLKDRVTLHGTVDETTLRAAYAHADLFILPSLHEGEYFEGFGLVFLEANAHGVPVIGPTTGGCPEAIDNGVSGYVCDPENAEIIAQHMADVLMEKKIKAEDCLQWAKDHDITAAAAKIETLYKQVIEAAA